jgi:alanine racemase
MGIHVSDALKQIKEMKKLYSLDFEGIFTHLADAENPASWQTENQLEKFHFLLQNLDKENIKFKYYHVGASAATLLIPSSRFNMVRIGISTYGLWASEETKEAGESISYLKDFKLKPALSFKTQLVEKKQLKAGSLIGYGGSYRLRKDSIIGVLPIGYAEGYDRKLSNNSEVLINNKKVKVIGNICMNMTIIDISNVPNSKIGDEVVLIGRQDKEVISVEDLAKKIDTINYEVTTRIPRTVKRIFI